MDSEPQPLPTPPSAVEADALDRSTGRPAHTPRAARRGDRLGRPGALPPAPGRPVSAVLPTALAALLVVISWQVAVDGPLLGIDPAVRDAVRHLRRSLHSTLLNHLGVALSDLGGGVPAVPVLLGCAGLAAWLARRDGRPRWWTPVPVAAVTAALIPLLVVPAKAWFARPGPFNVPLAPDQWGWYPSGHTATSAIAYGAAALLLARVLPARQSRRLGWATAAVCLGVGAGLVWSDFHWLLDVVASWCLSGLLLLALHRLLPRLSPDRTTA